MSTWITETFSKMGTERIHQITDKIWWSCSSDIFFTVCWIIGVLIIFSIFCCCSPESVIGVCGYIVTCNISSLIGENSDDVIPSLPSWMIQWHWLTLRIFSFNTYKSFQPHITFLYSLRSFTWLGRHVSTLFNVVLFKFIWFTNWTMSISKGSWFVSVT